MRSFLLATVSACLALVLPCAAWAQGAVYTMTNSIHNNQVVAYARATDGTLTQMQTISTHGGGSGIQFGGADADDTLGSQGSLLLDRADGLLFAINTENSAENLVLSGLQDCNQGSISTFVIRPNGRLTFAGKVASGGLFPDSLTLRGNVLYVLNAGGGSASGCGTAVNKNPNVTGFYVFPNGKMIQLPFSTRPIDPGPDGTPGFLNCDGTLPPCGLSPPLFVRSPGEVGFTPDGSHLVVTVKGTNSIYVFPYGFGYLGNPTIFAFKDHEDVQVQPTYFGFTFDDSGKFIVTEPFGTSATIPHGGSSAISSFSIGNDGTLSPIDSHVADGQTASCWLALDPISKLYLYSTNNVSGTISSFTVSDGNITLVKGDEQTLPGPNDAVAVKDGNASYLYVVASGAGEVYAYHINADSMGGLSLIGTYTGLPTAEATGQGIAAY
jgi:6-phosphogluconolactonase